MENNEETRVSPEDHQRAVDAVLPIAMALPLDAIREPDMPVDQFVREGKTVITACVEHKEALTSVGATQKMFDTFDSYVTALDSSETIWQGERKGAARREAFAGTIDEAEDERTDMLGAGDLALRKSQEGKERLSRIREGEGIADLAADLGDLALLLVDARPLFEAIKYPADEKAKKAASLRDRLRDGLAAEDMGKTLSQAKDERDRLYTLAHEAISEIRAFARFAFRNDRNASRNNLFRSDYSRRRDQRRRRTASSSQTVTS